MTNRLTRYQSNRTNISRSKKTQHALSKCITKSRKTNENLQKGVNVLQEEEKALDEEIIDLGKRVDMKQEELHVSDGN